MDWWSKLQQIQHWASASEKKKKNIELDKKKKKSTVVPCSKATEL